MHLSLKGLLEARPLQRLADRLGLSFWSAFLIFRHDFSTKDKLRRVFRRKADPFNYRGSAFERERLSLMEAFIKERTYRRALEIGCAEGAFTARLAPLCGELAALDISEPALRRAEAAVAAKNVAWIHANARDWQPESRLDLVVLGDFLYYLGDPEKGPAFSRALDAFIGRLFLWLAPGGRVLIADGYGTEGERRRNEDYARRLESAGLRKTRSEVVDGAAGDKKGMRCLIELFEKAGDG